MTTNSRITSRQRLQLVDLSTGIGGGGLGARRFGYPLPEVAAVFDVQ
jgi:hypothetical protein